MLTILFFFPVQLFQMVTQGQIDITGNGPVVIFGQPLDLLIDGVVKSNTNPYFQWFHNITLQNNNISANVILTVHIR